MFNVRRIGRDDVVDLTDFLREMDLSLSGLESESTHLWIERDLSSVVVASTGFELSKDGLHALIRSVAVHPSLRAEGTGSRLASFAIDQASALGARTAWLFSRRSGPFWQKLGFEPADRDAMALVLGDTHQVRLFVDSGQLEREVAWSRNL